VSTSTCARCAIRRLDNGPSSARSGPCGPAMTTRPERMHPAEARANARGGRATGAWGFWSHA